MVGVVSKATRAQKDARVFEQYFSDDPRFDFHGLVAYGNYGAAFRVKYSDPKTKTFRQFLIKKAFPSEEAAEALTREKHYLKRLRGAMHIVQMIDIPDNPLDQRRRDLPEIREEWIIMEWLEHGTIGDFVTKAISAGLERLPNRLLWRFFLCLIRGCIAMAWPPNRDDGMVEIEKIQGTTPSKLAHNDIHCENVLLAEPHSLDSEHALCPILKLIDFGGAGEWSWANGSASAVQSNIWEIGMIMITLIRLRTPQSVGNVGGRYFQMVDGGPQIETDAKEILPLYGEGAPCPELDPLLGRLVCACLATNHVNRPTLEELSTTVIDAVRTRGADFYGNHIAERDDIIPSLWRQIVNYAY
ncbi:kinase-like protein [Hypoxylon sp. NC0597]|nr:kinase-like protein [Hypoxylon sp. NC0597]